MAWQYLTVSMVALVVVVPAAAAEPARAPNFDALIEQLGHVDFKVRDAAADKLQAAGLVAVPALRKAVNHADLEVRRRVADLLPAIETAARNATSTERLRSIFPLPPVCAAPESRSRAFREYR